MDGAIALGIWGNPLRFANQDDVAQFLFRAHWQFQWVHLSPAVLAAPQSDRNPARIQTGFSAILGKTWYIAPSFLAGLTPASANEEISLELGYRFAPLPMH